MCLCGPRAKRIKLEPINSYFSVLFILPLWPRQFYPGAQKKLRLFVMLNYLQSGGHDPEQFKLLSVKSV